MNRQGALRRGWPILVLILIVMVAGCGGDDSTSPKPSPKLSMSLECNNGLIELTVRNSGGSPTDPSPFIAEFTDGHSDTLLLSVDAADSTTCRLSNIHGGVTVTNEEWDLEATTGDCLSDYFEGIFTSINLSDLVPSPLTQQIIILCTYTIYLRNLGYDNSSFQMIRTVDGLTLRYVLSRIGGDLAATSPGVLCPDLSGNVTIASIIVETRVEIGQGDDPPVTLGDTDATVNGLQVNVEGAFGFIVGWIISWFEDYFIDGVENTIESSINENVGSDLSSLVIVKSSCAE